MACIRDELPDLFLLRPSPRHAEWARYVTFLIPGVTCDRNEHTDDHLAVDDHTGLLIFLEDTGNELLWSDVWAGRSRRNTTK
jgi:hypothetical protein